MNRSMSFIHVLSIYVLLLTIPQILAGAKNKESCYSGAYRVSAPPFNQCSGFRDCEGGSYCVSGEKFSCPTGVYGDTTRLNSSSCSGPCPEGFYCPVQTVSGNSFTCGNSSVYCPLGSALPLLAPQGYYTVDTDGQDTEWSIQQRSSIKICPLGHKCNNGTKVPCNGGTYGSSQGLSHADCSGSCQEGWYCPYGSIVNTAHPCGSAKEFCPQRSVRPLKTAVGYYTVNLQLANGGGYTDQMICPRGSYCVDGLRHYCPPGHYGSTERMTNSSCSGLCSAGFYCPLGSFSTFQHQCNKTAYYCPTGSPEPLEVDLGSYSVSTVSAVSNEIIVDVFQTTMDNNNEVQGVTRMAQSQCEPGEYCPSDGIKRLCPPGRYGSTKGLTTSDCSGSCTLGYYCPRGSKHHNQIKCGGSNLFCPPGSAVPQTVGAGYYSVQGETDSTRGAERKCERGTYCINGTKHHCLPGYWGGEYGQTTPTCSGACSSGYYCPLGSVEPTEVMCGDPNKICPGNDFQPILVTPGFYSVGGTDSTRSAQVIAPVGHFAFDGLLYTCPAGTFGITEGLTSSLCSGYCSVPGYHCPPGSVHPMMKLCGGDDKFCPAGAVAPIEVHSGFYTADYDYETCPPGKWRNLTYPDYYYRNVNRSFSYVPEVHDIADCIPCPDGTFKSQVGNELGLCRNCDLYYSKSSDDRTVCECTQKNEPELHNHFNILTGTCTVMKTEEFLLANDESWLVNNSMTRYQQHACEPGHFCVAGQRFRCATGAYGDLDRETRPECAGLCGPGYFCQEASVSPYSYPCGDPGRICPVGSTVPQTVPPGYYSNEEAPPTLRSFYTICPKGYYCPGDGIRYKCSAGTFASNEGTISHLCEGVCNRGHYCLEGAENSTQYQCGNSTVYCTEGSAWPITVTEGFYGLHTGIHAGADVLSDLDNRTFSAEIPCAKGWYCTGGILYPCAPGRYGWRYGVATSECTGNCARGYYCPSYMIPNPIAPAYTVWKGEPHITATELECGDVGYYCPEGSHFPQVVSAGYYSVGGSSHNRTRYAQVQCEPGSYCQNAISILCPRGRYGETAGLSVFTCTDSCPAGFYCPPGAVVPLQCPLDSYSLGSAYECTVCPGGRTTPLTCQDTKECCNRG